MAKAVAIIMLITAVILVIGVGVPLWAQWGQIIVDFWSGA